MILILLNLGMVIVIIYAKNPYRERIKGIYTKLKEISLVIIYICSFPLINQENGLEKRKLIS